MQLKDFPSFYRYTHMTITDGKMVFEETYDEWVAKVKAHQAQEHQEHLEAEERNKKEREKMGLDY